METTDRLRANSPNAPAPPPCGLAGGVAEPLRSDVRVAWAWHVHQNQAPVRALTHEAAALLLDLLEPDDLVEFLCPAAVAPKVNSLQFHAHTDQAQARWLAARTLRSWILLDLNDAAATLVRSERRPPSSNISSNPHAREKAITFTVGDLTVKLFSGAAHGRIGRWLRNGVGGSILRVPELPGVIPVPDLALPSRTAAPTSAPPASEQQRVRVTTWRSAEQIALEHMRATGFPGAALTANGRDGGVDVLAPGAAAQVKHQGVPVGAPAVRQLRGAAPDATWWVFYSTAGYTSAAGEAAEGTGVALFVIGEESSVRAVNNKAHLLLAGAHKPESGEAAAVAFAAAVRERLMSLDQHHKPVDAPGEGRYRHYWRQALRVLEEPPTLNEVAPRSMVNAYRHAELLAAVYFRECGLGYPPQVTRVLRPPSVDDFYF